MAIEDFDPSSYGSESEQAPVVDSDTTPFDPTSYADTSTHDPAAYTSDHSPNDVQTLASDPAFDPAIIIDKNPSLAIQVAKTRAKEPWTIDNTASGAYRAVGSFFKAIPSTVKSFAKGGYEDIKDVATILGGAVDTAKDFDTNKGITPPADPEVLKAGTELGASFDAVGSNLLRQGYAAGRNASRLANVLSYGHLGQRDKDLTDEQWADRLWTQHSLHNMEESAGSGESALSDAGLLASPSELRSQGAPVNPEDIQNLSVILNPENLIPIGAVLKPGLVAKAAGLGLRGAGKTVEEIGGLGLSKFGKRASLTGAIYEALHGNLKWAAASLVAPYVSRFVKSTGEMIKTAGEDLSLSPEERMMFNHLQSLSGTQRGALYRSAQSVLQGSATGALAMAPFLSTAETPEELGSTLGAGAALGGIAAGAHDSAYYGRQKVFNSYFKTVKNNGSPAAPLSTESFNYGTDTGLDEAHNQSMLNISDEDKGVINQIRHMMQGAYEVYQLPENHYDDVMKGLGVKDKTQGMIMANLNGKPTILIKEGAVQSTKWHEVLHGVYDAMSPEAQAEVDKASFSRNDPDIYASQYTSQLKGKQTNVTYDSLTPAQQAAVRSEMAAETLGNLSIAQITQKPSIIRQIQGGLGRLAEGLGIPTTTPEVRSILGIQPTFKAAYILEQALRGKAKAASEAGTNYEGPPAPQQGPPVPPPAPASPPAPSSGASVAPPPASRTQSAVSTPPEPKNEPEAPPQPSNEAPEAQSKDISEPFTQKKGKSKPRPVQKYGDFITPSIKEGEQKAVEKALKDGSIGLDENGDPNPEDVQKVTDQWYKENVEPHQGALAVIKRLKKKDINGETKQFELNFLRQNQKPGDEIKPVTAQFGVKPEGVLEGKAKRSSRVHPNYTYFDVGKNDYGQFNINNLQSLHELTPGNKEGDMVHKEGGISFTRDQGAKYMPAINDGDVEHAAIKLKDGQVFTGPFHAMALDKAEETARSIDDRDKRLSMLKSLAHGEFDKGYTAKGTNEFLTKQQADDRAVERKQKLQKSPEGLDSTDLHAMPGTNSIAEASDEYNKSQGRDPVIHYALDKPKNAADIADAFDLMQHNPNDPKVKKSYQAFKDEIKKEWDYATNKLGIKIEPTDGDPYGFIKGGQPPHEQLFNDVINNKHISVFRGGNDLLPGHPLAEIDPQTGESYNTMFRAVHDIFGHVAGGHEFTEKGEESAWGRHKQMFPEDAVPAMTAETRGQTSWFFNNKGVREGKPTGEFAEQKAALLPSEFNKHSMFMPSTHPEAIDKTAIRLDDGTIISGYVPSHSMLKVPKGYKGSVERGWLQNNGNFVDNDKGYELAAQYGQIDKTKYKKKLDSIFNGPTKDKLEGQAFFATRQDNTNRLNIGLNTNDGKGITPEQATERLEATGAKIRRTSVHTSPTGEPTLVADLSRPLTPEEAHSVSEDLNQESIAQHANGRGDLHGPRAEDWRPFRKDYFIDHNGEPMSGRAMPQDTGKYEGPMSKEERAKTFATRLGLASVGETQDTHTLHDPITGSQFTVKKGDTEAIQKKLNSARLAHIGQDEMKAMPATNEPFYSQLRKTLESQPDKSTPEQLRAALKGPGIKAQELRDTKDTLGTNFEQWLKDNPKALKQDMLDFVNENKVKISEVSRFSKSSGLNPEEEKEYQSLLADNDPGEDELNRMQELRDQSNETSSGSVKFNRPDLNIPGGIKGTYGETSVTVPEKEIPDEFHGTQKIYKDRTPVFIGPHTEVPNEILHIRHDLRDLPDGTRGFMLQELQSDLHAKGRKEGYKPTKRVPRVYRTKENPDGTWTFDSPYTGELTGFPDEHSAIYEGFKQSGMGDGGVPGLPFKGNSWKKLGLKVALKKAIEAGADHLLWTTGDQQIARYDLSKRLADIYAVKKPDGTYHIFAREKNENTALDKIIPEKDLDQTVGKDLAEKIRRQEKPTTYSGLDLKVGGEWAHNLYDKEIPNILNDLGKKYGAKVSEVRIPVKEEVYSGSFEKNPFAILGKSGKWTGESFKQESMAQEHAKKIGGSVVPISEVITSPVHSFTIPEAMKADIRDKGQSLFMPAGFDSSSAENLSDTRGMDSKSFGNFNQGIPIQSHRFSDIKIPSQGAMQGGMLSSLHNPKILDSVVRSLPVNVMDYFKAQKLSPEMFFHDPSMLRDSSGNQISIPADIASSIMGVITDTTAKMSRPSLNLGDGLSKGLDAVGANNINSHISNISQKGDLSSSLFMPSTDHWSDLYHNLTPEERDSVRDSDANKVLSIFRTLDPEKGKQLALAGKDMKTWYQDSAKTISHVFGPDADRFTAFLAALSPRKSVEQNLRDALHLWANWLDAGRPGEGKGKLSDAEKQTLVDLIHDSTSKENLSIIHTQIPNVIRALSAEDPSPSGLKMSGPKVNSFFQNLRENLHEVTQDGWMYKYSGLGGKRGFKNRKAGKPGSKIDTKGFDYLAMNAHIRQVADMLTQETGETWAPAEVQAAIWSQVKSQAEGGALADVVSFDKIFKRGDLTAKDLRQIASKIDIHEPISAVKQRAQQRASQSNNPF